jgi:hypothetical protein
MEAVVRQLGSQLKIWQRAALFALWIVIATLLGVIEAIIDAEHGSVVFVVVGLYVGIAGAITSLLLSFVPHFGRLTRVGRVLTSTVVASLPIVLFLTYDSFARTPYPMTAVARASYLALMGGTATVVAFIGAIVIAAIESRRSNQRSD